MTQRPHSSINFDVLLRMNTLTNKQSDIAELFGCYDSQISRKRNGTALTGNESLVLARHFEFAKHGLEEWILEAEPGYFLRELIRVGFGKFSSAKIVDAYLATLPISAGYFVCEDHLSRLLNENGEYRHFGPLDTDIEVPNEFGVIGQRYGLALEITYKKIVAAIKQRQSVYSLLLHRDRSSNLLTIADIGVDCIVSVLPSIFAIRAETDPGDEPNPVTIALYAKRGASGGEQLGYRIGGVTSRRDIYIFVFTTAPKLGSEWKTAKSGDLVDPSMMQALIAAVGKVDIGEEPQLSSEVMLGHVVYDATLK